MKTLLLSLLVVLGCAGCASTTVYGPDGRRVLHTSADALDVRFEQAAGGGAVIFTARRLDHSTPTLARGKAVADRLQAVGAAAAAVGASAILR